MSFMDAPNSNLGRADSTTSSGDSAIDRQHTTFRDHLAAERRYSPHTQSSYGRDISDFIRFLKSEGLPLDAQSVTAATIRLYLASLFDHKKPETVARRISSLRSFFGFLHKRHLIQQNPAFDIKTPKRAKTLPRFLTVDQTTALMAGDETPATASGPLAVRDRAIVELLYGAGLRVSELTGIDVLDVDCSQRLLRVMGKGSKPLLRPLAQKPSRRWMCTSSIAPNLCEKKVRQSIGYFWEKTARRSPRARCKTLCAAWVNAHSTERT